MAYRALMPSNRVIRVRAVADGVAGATLQEEMQEIWAELEVTPEFPPEAEEAARAAAASPRLPQLDRTDIELVTIDPDGARDLDQALHIERDGSGYTVHYAIADVAAFVSAGDPVDAEAHRRGETLYGADTKVPLHPKAISEDAASLLPEQVRPALLWTLSVDSSGEGTGVRVERALVRSRAQLTYEQAQQMIDSGSGPASLALLKEVGELRIAREIERGGVNIPLPDQEISVEGGTWRLEFRALLPVEDWNAQISLLTGMAAASLMVEHRVGVLRTLPLPDPRDVSRLRRTARGLGISWPEEESYASLIRRLDPAAARDAAMIVASTRLLRGSGYAAFDGTLPELTRHEALAAEYAHVTAPLRRLVDRYAGEICVALCAGRPVPGWVREALPTLPDEMRESGRRSGAYERAVVDLVEAGLLASRVGERFDAVVVEVEERDPRRGTVTVQEPAIEAAIEGEQPLPLGEDVRVELAVADVEKRKVAFRLV